MAHYLPYSPPWSGRPSKSRCLEDFAASPMKSEGKGHAWSRQCLSPELQPALCSWTAAIRCSRDGTKELDLPVPSSGQANGSSMHALECFQRSCSARRGWLLQGMGWNRWISATLGWKPGVWHLLAFSVQQDQIRSVNAREPGEKGLLVKHVKWKSAKLARDSRPQPLQPFTLHAAFHLTHASSHHNTQLCLCSRSITNATLHIIT